MKNKQPLFKALRAKGYAPIAYAELRGLDYLALKRVLVGVAFGRRNNGGLTRAVLEALYSDGVLPDEHFWVQNRDRLLNKGDA